MNEKIKQAGESLKKVRISLNVETHLPNDEEIDDYEKDIGIKFSNDYRIFLKEASDSLYNGRDVLRITPGRDHPRELCVALQEARDMGLPKDWLPFSEDNGNYFCFVPDGSIRFWDHNGFSDERWSDLATWIKEVWICEQ